MFRKLVYLAFFPLLAAFVFLPGALTHGQGDRPGQLKNRTEYAKSGQGETSGTDGEAGQGEEKGGQAQPPAAENGAGGTGAIVSDAGGVMPADYHISLPPPSAREARENLERMLRGMQLSEAQNKLIGLRLLNSASTFLGIPYQRDGRGDCVRGIDCSKLTRCAAIKAGLEPKSFVALAGAQYGYSLKGQYNMRMVSGGSLANVQPGDFLFFNWRDAFSRARPYSIGHVALYIGPTKGNAMYLIEAGNPVQKRWGNTKYLVGVGRIVKAP